MPDVPLASLDPRQQKLVGNARIALERGHFDYAIEVMAQVLRAQPGCLPVRRLQRLAQLRAAQARRGFLGRVVSGLSAAPFLLGGKKEPARQLETAETLLAKDPNSIVALKLLAAGAAGLGFPETVAFALEAIRELDPGNRANLLALAEAWLTAHKPAPALEIADELLRLNPVDAAAQDLLRRASVAQTIAKVEWENQETYRNKLRDEERAVALEQQGRVVATDAMRQRLLDEALAGARNEPLDRSRCLAVAQAFRQLGQFDDALAWIRKARQQPGGAADAALEQQESELAAAAIARRVDTAETAAAAAPADAGRQAAAEAARQELRTFQLDEAWRRVERHPNDYAARHALGARLFEAGELDAAIAQFQQAQKGPHVRVASLAALGRCFRAKRLHDLAIAQLTTAKNEAGALDAAKKEILYELGVCYELAGKPEAAIEEFKTIYSEDIGFRDVAEKIDAFYAQH